MVKIKSVLTSTRFPNFKLKIKLGALLLCLITLSNYQPTFNFPPIKSNLVYAEITQEQAITPQASPLTFQLPHPGYITTHFSNYHPGIDLCSGLGMPIKSIAPGKVVEAGFNFFGLGLVVEVEHEGGYRSLYAHMGKIFVKKDQEIDSNDYIGEIGMTGHTTGPHTHLEISKDGTKIDPLLILPEIRNYPKEEDFVTIQSATPSAVTAPIIKPASGSAKVNLTPEINNPSPLPSPKTEEAKIDLKTENLKSILNMASPKPSASPLPQGGKLSLKNFTLFGFKK